jgi:pimeloyl-ACP methyl ester carboxylesterase
VAGSRACYHGAAPAATGFVAVGDARATGEDFPTAVGDCVTIDPVTKKTRSHVDDLRGASRLAIEATRSVTDLVEAMHVTIGGGPAVLGRPLEGPTRLATGLVYKTIRGVTQLVGAGIDLALAQLGPLLGDSVPGAEREALLAVLNGVLGDYLSDTNNPLAIATRLRHDGHALALEPEALRAAFPKPSRKLVILVHGSCMHDRHWLRLGHDHGAALARDLGYTPLYVHYNSGLHISANGRALAALLEALVTAWPLPIDEVAIVGHSMGGLVARSACHSAEAAHHRWRGALRRLVCVGSPHHGAALERGGNWIDVLLGVSRYSAPLARLGQIRSAGVTDLRYGNVLDEHWHGRDRFARGPDTRTALALPDGVDCYAIAASTSPGAQPAQRLAGDGLVSVDSALGRHARPELTLAFPVAHQWIGFGMGHLDLLGRPEVYETIRRWLG